jgi:hypothetical protein
VLGLLKSGKRLSRVHVGVVQCRWWCDGGLLASWLCFSAHHGCSMSFCGCPRLALSKRVVAALLHQGHVHLLLFSSLPTPAVSSFVLYHPYYFLVSIVDIRFYISVCVAVKPFGGVLWVSTPASRVSEDRPRRRLVRCLRPTSPRP